MLLTSLSPHVTEVLEAVPHQVVDLIEVVHEAPPVQGDGEGGEVLTDPSIETREQSGVRIVQAGDIPVRKVATKHNVRNTLSLQLCRVVQVSQVEVMLLLLTDQSGLVPLPGLTPGLYGGVDELAQRGEIKAELSGETGQSE